MSGVEGETSSCTQRCSLKRALLCGLTWSHAGTKNRAEHEERSKSAHESASYTSYVDSCAHGWNSGGGMSEMRVP